MQQSSRRGRSLLEADRHSLEFTSGQLVLAICGLLLLWLAGFVMGVAADRVRFGSEAKAVAENEKTETAPAAAKTTDKPETKNAAKPAPPSRRTAAKPETKESATPKKAPAPAPAAPAPRPAPATTAKAQDPAAPKFLPDVPSTAATRTQPAAPAPASSPETVAVASVPVTPPDTPAPAAPAPEAPKADAATAAPPAETPESAAASKNTKGNFLIQIISYKVANKKLADEYAKRLQSNAGLDVSVIKSKDGKTYQIVYGNYGDRSSAEKAQAELKKKPEFADCIVRER